VAALEALYDSADNPPQPQSHTEAHRRILDSLYEWLTGDSGYWMYWLHGPEGAGKSAIMQTLCERLQDRFGGAFFFKQGHPTTGNAKALFATLAYQLALHHPELRSPISKSVERNPSVLGKNMEVQLQELIVK
ncbi:hypothetical protein K438DRAFT_1518481, partial [Mycena galopus ATCC 62051]